MLSWLADIAGIDVDTFAREFFEVGSPLRESTPPDALGSDRKEYTENGWRISISQIEELGLDVLDGLVELVKGKTVKVEGVILVTHAADGSVNVQQTGDNLGRKGMGWGGGVGLAAIQVARQQNAEIFATAGSPENDRRTTLPTGSD